jgi:hypothetical protein
MSKTEKVFEFLDNATSEFTILPMVCGSLWYLGVPAKSAAIAAIVAWFCAFCGYGQEWFRTLAGILVLIAVLVWLQILPPMEKWDEAIRSAMPQLPICVGSPQGKG